ncbi:hypothetical protein MesoLjLa_49260 [Mesorhizobium sp. L-2-11]|nr:hypothetical protein MesoLjLa_49260 [Mesorhizobium sp. L-2-11]
MGLVVYMRWSLITALIASLADGNRGNLPWRLFWWQVWGDGVAAAASIPEVDAIASSVHA